MPLVEIWKTYPGCSSYEVSNLGRVRSVDRTVTTKHGRSWTQRGKILSIATNHLGRTSVVISKNGECRSVQVSHLVYETFVGPRPDGMFVRHLNDCKDDNRIYNLSLGTPLENIQDKVRNGLDPNAIKTHCKWGHEFTEWNIVRTPAGNRQCKSCKRARSHIHYPANRWMDHQIVSDGFFEELEKRTHGKV